MTELDVNVERDAYSAPFFDAAAANILLVRVCPNCGSFGGPNMVVCRLCHSRDTDWTAASGKGVLLTWTVDSSASGTGRADVAALVELEEGPWIPVRITADPGELTGGMEVVVQFHRPGSLTPEFVPMFSPASTADPTKYRKM